MQKPENESNVKVVRHPDIVREELTAARAELKALMRESNKEPDLTRQSELQLQVARLNRKVAKLMDEAGLSALQKVPDPKREARRKFLPTQEMTVNELLQLAAAGKATPEGANALKELREIPGVQSIIMPWVPPPFNPMPSADSVAATMNGAVTFKPLQAVLRSKKDPHFKPAGGLKNLATVAQPPQYVGQDGEWIALLQQLPTQYAHHRERAQEALKKAVTGYYVASGPFEGWIARILKGDRRLHPNFVLTSEEMTSVMKLLPWNPDHVPEFATASFLDLLKAVRINGSAGAGFPRYHKKAVVMEEILKDAVEYYELLSKKELVRYMAANPGEFLTQAKMKLDRYEADDWGKKVRPYYNLNGGLALVYSCVVQAYSGALVGFWENPTSCNAHGFSWNSGGGDRLYGWVLWAAAQAPGVYAIGYSDDGLWVVVGEDKKVWVSDRDIAQCDASCGNSFLPPYRAHLVEVLGKKLNAPWRNVALAAATAVFKQVVILYKSLVYSSDNKVHSGTPGTAEADQVAFTVLYALIKAAYAALPPDGDPVARFEKAAEVVRKRIGLEFKEAKWTEFRPGQDSYPWEFLGKRLVKFRGHYIPIVPYEKAVVQLVTPKSNRGGLEGQRAWMERARGLAVTSLFWHEELYELARQAYERKAKMGLKPAATMDGEETGEGDLEQILGQGLQVRFPDARFPSRQWIYGLYLGMSADEEKEQHVHVLSPVQSAASVFEALFAEEEDEPGAAWADTAPPSRELAVAKTPLPEDAAQRINPVPPPAAATKEEQYQLPKLPDEVKQAFHEARRAAFRAFAKQYPAQKGKFVRGGKMEALVTGEADIVFTRKGIRAAWDEAVEQDQLLAVPEDDEEWESYYGPDLDDEEIDAHLETREARRLEEAWERVQRKGRR